MNVRHLILLFAAPVCLLSGVEDALAQASTKLQRIGVLTNREVPRLRDNLRELGYVEGRNVSYEVRETDNKAHLLDALAAELVSARVDVIIAHYPAAVIAARRATATIPIVMVNTPDPVSLGLVASLARPGGNVTGTTSLSVEVSVKQLQLLKEAVPRASRIAVLSNPDNPWHPKVLAALREEKRVAEVRLQMLSAGHPKEFEAAFDAMARERADALLVLADPLFNSPSHTPRLTELALARGLPIMGGVHSFTQYGGLMSYWANEADLYRRVASYVDRILKGARPGDLPIEQPKTYELVINETTAKALGRTLPGSLTSWATLVQ